MIALEQVSRAPGGLPVLSEVSFHISDTDRLGVVGPNGSGKTTLLRLLAGYDEADAGIIRRSRGQRLGYLPQEVAEIGERPVLEIVLDGAPEVRELERRIDRIESVARGERAGEEGDDPAELGALYDQLAALGGRGVEARAKRILSGLGFSDEEMTRSAATFSGGWLMRIVLGKLLLAHPDVLLLDEPTNHLDLPSLEWLETFLQEHHGALVVVSHDRVFLDRLVTDVLEVDSASVVRWAGNCTSWIAARELRAAQEEHAAAHERRRRAEVERFVERFRYKNTKAKQVQSRIKALERSDASGGVSSPERKRSSLRGFDFPQPERTARLVASLESAVVGYGAEPVLRGVDFAVQRGERVALLGANGTGKSTLLKVLAGSIPLEERVHTATLAQHQVHELDLDATVLTLATAVDPAAPIRRVRAALGALAFREEDMEKPVGVLSGGEKARLALARMLLKPAPLLLLDEPTSHLDVTARAALEHALLTFEGTIVFVSHDRHFINALASAVVELRDGDALRYEGNYDNWRSQKKAAEATQEAQPESFEQVDEAATEPQKLSRKDERRAAAELRKRRTEQLGPLEREVKEIEDAIAETEQALADLDLLISDPDFYAKQVDGGVFRERSELRERADELTERWVETKERLEQAEREFEEAERELS